jgi:hypothetical protein
MTRKPFVNPWASRDIVRACRQTWSEQQNICFHAIAWMDLNKVDPESARGQATIERVVKRREIMWQQIETAVAVPIEDEGVRPALQAFLDLIELRSSSHDDRDLELIEARLHGKPLVAKVVDLAASRRRRAQVVKLRTAG